MYAVKVEKQDAQKKINSLKAKNQYDRSRKILEDGDMVWIPVTGEIPGSTKKTLKKREKTPGLGEAHDIHSFDIIGEVAVVFIPDVQRNTKGAIGQHIMKLHPRLKAVYMEVGAASGEFRLQQLELIAGPRGGSETVHKENGLSFELDVLKVFFSPRQLTERMKLTSFVNEGEVVCVFFSGVAPIPIYLSSFSKPLKVIGIELNPDSHEYGLKNLQRNKIENVELIKGDVRKLAPTLGPIDLIIMPLPKGALLFLDTASQSLKVGGRVIVYVASSPEELDTKLKLFEKHGFRVAQTRKELQISPKEWRYVIHAVKIE
ncbi:MAG: class I SAM-dependent methyltransferase family protein [Candidatus Altiarchaeota archaeon]|nr:class I SAM-dependent methyltransferase family protein [Candidatus Altiarchaeota archaeon]